MVTCTSQYLTFKLAEQLFAVTKCLVSTMLPKAQSGMAEMRAVQRETAREQGAESCNGLRIFVSVQN